MGRRARPAARRPCSRTTAVYAVDRSSLYREHLARLMRRALAEGYRRDLVVALSALPRDEAEALLASA